jgi:hypothetical protein
MRVDPRRPFIAPLTPLAPAARTRKHCVVEGSDIGDYHMLKNGTVSGGNIGYPSLSYTTVQLSS